ncbi:MAG: 4Fe-4S binding protein [Alphaproteobacteria bacterium]|uniref:4Fe-4S binding protein n=1 Tax=Candidatus Nitrobium versatile TaxID=2884831 RepID=A0A953JDA8_9BACT|nr:4Fe-4S binding protein [Candidatus Nitrobium versatile]
MAETKELKVEEIKKSAEEKSCPVQRSLYYISEFLSGPMCGRCFPCAMGSYEARTRLQTIIEGRGTEADIRALKRITAEMAEASMCKKGKDTASFISGWLNEGAFHEHVGGTCSSGECIALIEYRVVPGNCTACGRCKEVCTHNAVTGEKAKPYRSGLPFEIRQKRCTRCGECIKVCPEEAIVLVGVKDSTLAGV